MFGLSPFTQHERLPVDDIGMSSPGYGSYAQSAAFTPYGGVGLGLGSSAGLYGARASDGWSAGRTQNPWPTPNAGPQLGGNLGSAVGSGNGSSMGSRYPVPGGLNPWSGSATNSNGYNMMYNPYVQQWGMMPGAHATGMAPYAMGGQNPMNPMMAQGAAAAAAEAAMKPFEPGRMKQGRQGHYGYLEGRELAGPPVGFLPAGVTPQMQQPPHPHPAAMSHHTPSPAPAGTRTPSAYDPAPTVAGSQPRTAWGEQSNAPRARYDGTSAAQQYMKADLDSPYPRIGNGGVASAWTKYSNDKTPLSNGMGEDGRLASNHRRMREGEV